MVSENPYFSGEGILRYPTPKDLVFAVTGIASSQVRVGLCYLLGSATKQDFPQARMWFEKAADQGNACGLFNLALMYQQGKVEGGLPDIQRAVHYYEKAAAKGHADAQLNLGILYIDGEGVEKDIPKAMQLFVASAKSGNRVAEFLLVVFREHWKSTDDNEVAALTLLTSSANKGYPPAQELLGTYYFNESNFYEAFRWYGIAASQGHVLAMYRLGEMYSDKKFIETLDLVLAYFFMFNASERNHSEAIKALCWLETIMTANELIEAKRHCENLIISDCSPDESAVDLYDIRDN